METSQTAKDKIRQNIIEVVSELHDQDAEYSFSAFIFAIMELPQVIEAIKAFKLAGTFYFLNEVLHKSEKDQLEHLLKILEDLKPRDAHHSFARFIFHIYQIDEVVDIIAGLKVQPTLSLIQRLLKLSNKL